jgi:hypothetical protein
MESNIKKLPSQDFLLECFEYNKENGSLIWKTRPEYHFKKHGIFLSTNKKFVGKEAGSVFMCRGQHRSMIWISGQRFYKHRIIWKLVTGKDPIKEIDHEDTNTLNDSWSNLREADDHQNSCNRNIRVDNKTGFKGVYLRKDNGRYRVIITTKGTPINLGTFLKIEDAANAYKNANPIQHKDFSRI